MTSDYIIVVAVELTLKKLQNIPISCVMIMMTSDYMIIVTVELTLKNGYRTYPYHMLW